MLKSDPIIFAFLWRVRLFLPTFTAFSIWASSGNGVMFGVFICVAVLDFVMARWFLSVMVPMESDASAFKSPEFQMKVEAIVARIARSSWTVVAFFVAVAMPFALLGYFDLDEAYVPMPWGQGFRFYLFGLQFVLLMSIQSLFAGRVIMRSDASMKREGERPYFFVVELLSYLWPKSGRERVEISFAAVLVTGVCGLFFGGFFFLVHSAATSALPSEQILPVIGIAIFLQLLISIYFVLMGRMRRYVWRRARA